MKTLLVVVAFILFSACVNAEVDKETNDAIDDLLNEIKKNAVNDTIKLDIKGGKFSKKFGSLDYSAEATWKNTKLTDVKKTLRKEGDAKITWPDDKPVVLSLPLALGPIRFSTTGRVKVMGLGPSFDYKGAVKYVKASAKITYNSTTEALRLRDFEVTEISGFRVKEKGLMLPSRIIRNYFLRLAGSSFERFFRKALSNTLKEVLVEEVENWDALKTLMH